jgi:hypothetical protein
MTAILYNSIYHADDQVLVIQHIHGISAERSPVLHLRPASDADLVTTYLDSLERTWTHAVPLE